MQADKGKRKVDGADAGLTQPRSRSFTSQGIETRDSSGRDSSGGTPSERGGPLGQTTGKTMARPKRRMSRRYSHHRNESAPDFFDDLDVLNTLMPMTGTGAGDVDGSLHRRTRSKDRSPASSAVFTTTTGASGERPVPLRQPSSDFKGTRPLHMRRRSGSSDDWEIGLKQALNLEVTRFKSEENMTKMKTKYRRALQPRGMLKVPGSPAMRTSTVNMSRVAAQHSNKKPDAEKQAGSNPHESSEMHYIKPKSLDMDALAAGRDGDEFRRDIMNNDTSRSESAIGNYRGAHHHRAGSTDAKSSTEGPGIGSVPMNGGLHARRASSERSASHNSDDGDAGNGSIVINDIDDEFSIPIDAENGNPDGGEEIENAEPLTLHGRIWNRCLVYLFYLHTSILFQIVVLLASIVALLAADISSLSVHRQTESLVDVFLGISACLLLLDLIVCLHIRRGYSYTILSLMDFIAVLSIVIEIRWVFKVLLIFFAKTDSFENFFDVMSEIAESARLTNAPKILRITLQLLSHCFDIEGYVADVNYIIGEENEDEKPGADQNKDPKKQKEDTEKFKDLKIVLPDELNAGSLATIEDCDGETFYDAGSNGSLGGRPSATRDRTDSTRSVASDCASSDSEYEYEDEDNDMYSFKKQEVRASQKHSMKRVDDGAIGKPEQKINNRAKIPGSTLILAVDKIASPWLHEIGTVVLEFMTARMVVMLLLFMLIVRLLQNKQPSNQKEMGLRFLDNLAQVGSGMNSTDFRLALEEYTLRHDGLDKKGTFYNKEQPLAYLRINGVDLLDADDMQQLYGRREDEVEYTMLRSCAKPPINERFARMVLMRECRSIAIWDNRRILRNAAVNNIMKTMFITLTLALGMFMIGYDLNVLVLEPIDGIYQMGKDMLYTINWAGIGKAMKAAEAEDDDDLDEYQRNVRSIARQIIMCGDLFVKSKPILNQQFSNFRRTAEDLDHRYGKNKEDLVPAVDSIIQNINPTVEAVKLIVDGVDAVMAPTVGDIDIYAPKREEPQEERQPRRRSGGVQTMGGVGSMRSTHGYHRGMRRDSNIHRQSTMRSSTMQRRNEPATVGFRRTSTDRMGGTREPGQQNSGRKSSIRMQRRSTELYRRDDVITDDESSASPSPRSSFNPSRRMFARRSSDGMSPTSMRRRLSSDQGMERSPEKFDAAQQRGNGVPGGWRLPSRRSSASQAPSPTTKEPARPTPRPPVFVPQPDTFTATPPVARTRLEIQDSLSTLDRALQLLHGEASDDREGTEKGSPDELV